MAKEEKPLAGGNMTEVAKRGKDVLRETGPWTPTVQRLLDHLREQGIEWAPAPKGWTEDGREALGYIKGTVPTHPMPDWVYNEQTLVRAAAWMRQFHDATQDYLDPEARWRVAARQPVEVICHNDFTPANMVFRNEELVGVIDWDFAAPGPHLWDLAYLAYRLVPLMRPENPQAPDLHIDLSARLRLLLEAYGSDAPVPVLLEVMVARLEDLASLMHSLGIARKDETLLAEAENYTADAAYLSSLLH
ncbi:MAG: phosphotransferase enzyme family protein [Propioniciclava sp.]